MFDFTQHGSTDTHRYRGYYDAGEQSTSHCSQCNRVIRFCYSLHDQHMKSFVIGTCCFQNYSGKLREQLDAARLLQEALRSNIQRDQRLYGGKAEVRDSRRAWSQARRKGERLVRTHVMLKGDWLPKELFELKSAAEEKPRQWKRQSAAKRWYEQQTEKIIALTNQATSI
jgi:hypothetical protein